MGSTDSPGLHELKAGDEVIVLHRYDPVRRAKITEVRRKYFRVEGEPNTDFNRSDGRVGESYHHYVLTPTEYLRRKQEAFAEHELRVKGITLVTSAAGSLRLEIYRAVQALLDLPELPTDLGV